MFKKKGSKMSNGFRINEAEAGLIVGNLVYLLFVLFLFVGWIMNIVKLTKCDFEKPYTAEVVRSVGVVAAPVGGVLGWLKFDEEKEPILGE